ncbi:type II secretion system protein [Ruficoccus amylovorans]|uniref:Type II secretion system protein n=1 Tax=Ruficoccus amylovorans TaxID=1804625 RepID=A0A842HKL4_9BACT|nr:type II secretion system protein [Ruficoccus amylovorans]MBC2596017.1 type II secretion system protein [Ruficoccus amylovorans]
MMKIPRIENDSHPLDRNAPSGFSLIELLVVIVVIGILGSLIIGAVQHVRTMSKRVASTSNLRSIGQGFGFYLADNNNTYFGAGPGSGASGPTYEARGYYRWPQRLGPYMNLEGEILNLTTSEGDTVQVLANAYRHAVFHTPFTDERHWKQGDDIGKNSTMGIYGINTKIAIGANRDGLNITGVHALDIRNPSRTILMGEHFAGPEYTGESVSTAGVELHRSGPYPDRSNGLASNTLGGSSDTGPTMILFADGHVESIEISELDPWPDTEANRTGITFLP